ncbi:MAK10-like protein [Tanacetum coccineum]
MIHVSPITSEPLTNTAGGKLCDKNDEESWALLEDLALYDNESWNEPRDFAKLVKAIFMPHDVPNASDRIVRNVEVHVGKLKLFEDFHVVDMEREPTCPLLVGRGFLATANAVIDCKKAKIAVGEGITRLIFGVKEVDFGDDNEPYWTTIGKRESYKPRTSKDGIDMDQDYAYMVAASKVPMLKPGEYEIWKMRIEQYIQMIDYALWEVIENGLLCNFPKKTKIGGKELVMTEMPITTAKEKA